MAAYAAVVSLKATIQNLLKYLDMRLLHPSLKLAEFLFKEVKSFENFLERLDSKKRMNASLAQTTAAIREFNEILVSHVVKQLDSQQKNLDIQDLHQDIHSFARMLKELQEYFSGLHEEEDVAGSSRGNKSKMVGLSDLYDQLKEDILVSLHDHAFYFSIVGMAGIGKTTLVKKLFEDFDVLEWFDCCAWVVVGIEGESREIPRRVLAQITDEMVKEGDEKIIGEYLREGLKGKRYLIVLDDVWDARVYGYLNRFLPKEGIGSRVILTTRMQGAVKRSRLFPHSLNMRLLNKEESWDLLRERVFDEEEPCPPQLRNAGKKIAENCDGLPLTIVTVANLLSKAEKTPEYWNEVATWRNQPLLIDAHNRISEVLYSSYEYLYEELKECFLFMGVFPRNYQISRSELINLWIAEGVLHELETRAVECLEELAANNVVMVNQNSSNNRDLWISTPNEGIKTCGLHSSWWQLCYKEARNHNLFHVLNSCEDSLGQGIKGQKRLAIHNNILLAIKDVYNTIEENCAPTASSLLCFGPYTRYPVPICFGLRLLQCLDALKIRFYEFPLQVLELVGLKLLTLTYNGELPPSISKLVKLQFLIVRRHLSAINSHGDSTCLPVDIWDMKELKHLQITGSDLPDLCGSSLLPNLLALLDVSAKSCTKGILVKTPNLERLGIRIELTPDFDEPLRCFDHISCLEGLKSLKCVVVNPELGTDIVSVPPIIPFLDFPSNLMKLTLAGMGYPWKEMSIIASLPNLQCLKLKCNAFQGSEWEIEENQFEGLSFLLIEDLDLVQWKVGNGSFKKLSYLSIKHCYKLEEFHWGLNYFITRIEVVDSNPSIEEQIKETMLRAVKKVKEFSVQSSWINDGNSLSS